MGAISSVQTIRSLVEQLREKATVDAVYGDPIVAEGRTTVPVAHLRYGFGGGFGSGEIDNDTESERAGEGGGFGGGATVTPLGVVEITAEDVRFVPTTGRQRFVRGFVTGAVAGLVLGRRLRKRTAG
ncbi:spore germination protein GerW family protein [Haloprofundus salilacus]|uniref:spore germination protein GerW family protein n=1 Tax=Haloprofundus salilacus TaxID=2876190 RepID=UPI001CCA00B3|nr:spore germination protein GerW family protein [Haloprofundus salilacus]